MEEVTQLLKARRWANTCLRTNIATPDDIEVRGKVKVARIKSNVLKREREPRLYDAIKGIAPEWWGDETRITLNKDVVCQKHKDGNEGHSWMLWLGDYTQGGELHFENGAVIKEKGVWHKFMGQVPHWNTPHEGGSKYSVILYRSTKQPKYEALLGYKKRKHDAAAAANLGGSVGESQGVVGGVVAPAS
jgi:hypothetical protein